MTLTDKILSSKPYRTGVTFTASSLSGALSGVNTNSLAQHLSKMVKDGLVHRTESRKANGGYLYSAPSYGSRLARMPWRKLTNEQVGIPADWRPL